MKSFYYKQPYADEQVRATIAGEKTLMIFPIKLQPKTSQYVISRIVCSTDRKERGKYRWVITNDEKTIILKSSETFKSPFEVGERYWLKECFGKKIRGVGGTPHESICYRADNPKEVRCYDLNGNGFPVNWHQSIHMPQWISRCTIEVKQVYVKRVQDIDTIESKKLGASKRAEWVSGDAWNRNDWCWFVEFEVVQ